MKRTLLRKWVNQPSISCPYHNLHRTNVLFDPDEDRIWFLSGDAVSQQIDPSILENGWFEHSSSYKKKKGTCTKNAIVEILNLGLKLEDGYQYLMGDEIRHYCPDKMEEYEKAMKGWIRAYKGQTNLDKLYRYTY